MDRDRLLAFAMARALEILGEAASKVAPETRRSMPQIAWTQIIAMRNRLAHAYHDLNYNIMWRTATVEVAALLPHLRAAVADESPR
jgi:uncharacterized protein with HEPN domain